MLIVGPNLSVDRTLSLPELRPGEVLRFSRAAVTPGGKGVNVARVARALTLPAHLVGFAGGRIGDAVVKLIGDEGLPLTAVSVEGEIRSSAIILEDGGRITVLNEPGPAIIESDWGRLEAAAQGRLRGHSILICIGSSPPGTPADAYARLARRAHRGSVPVLVDASGELLSAALDAGPDFVSPNLMEAEGLLQGRTAEGVDTDAPDVPERARAAAAALVRRGAGVALVTAGGAGVALAGGGGEGWIDAPAVTVVNPVGAGDAFVGGFCGALERGAPIPRAAVEGVATASASVETPVAGGVDPARVEALRESMDAGP